MPIIRPVAWLAALVVLIVGAVIFFTSESRPGDIVTLHGSTWTIAEAEGHPLDAPATLTFDQGQDFGALTSPCGKLSFEFGGDTDSASFTFVERGHEPLECSAAALSMEEELRAALRAVAEWRAPSPDRIEFLDANHATVLVAKLGT
jgi:hypothetical protein